jgi:hypothetical protein
MYCSSSHVLLDAEHLQLHQRVLQLAPHIDVTAGVLSQRPTSPLLLGSSVNAAPMAAAALSKVARAVSAADAGTGTTFMWQWLPPDLRNAMNRSNATACLPCSENP